MTQSYTEKNLVNPSAGSGQSLVDVVTYADDYGSQVSQMKSRWVL